MHKPNVSGSIHVRFVMVKRVYDVECLCVK